MKLELEGRDQDTNSKELRMQIKGPSQSWEVVVSAFNPSTREAL